MQALIENNYVKKDNLTHQYELTFKLFQLGYASIQNIDHLNIAKSLISLATIVYQTNKKAARTNWPSNMAFKERDL